MNKHTLAQKIANKIDLPKKSIIEVLELVQDIIIDALIAGEEVTLAGFGTFSSRTRGARMGVNPRKPTEAISIHAVKVAKFKTGKRLKDALKAG
ncbi:MAG: HU family DNA-binding protein [Patescibacteria group bacterium]